VNIFCARAMHTHILYWEHQELFWPRHSPAVPICTLIAQEESIRQMLTAAWSVYCTGVQASVRVLTCHFSSKSGGVDADPGAAGARGCCPVARRRRSLCWRPQQRSRGRRRQEAAPRMSTSGSAPCAGSEPGCQTVGFAAKRQFQGLQGCSAQTLQPHGSFANAACMFLTRPCHATQHTSTHSSVHVMPFRTMSRRRHTQSHADAPRPCDLSQQQG
jgi:hypothetical protein